MSFASVTGSRFHSRITGIFLAIVGLLALAACGVVSINPLYEDVSPKDPDIVFENKLVGSWTISDGKCITIVTVTSRDDVYDLRTGNEGKGCSDPAEMVREQARLVKLDTYYFLDISPRPDDVCGTCLALHQIFLASLAKDMLSLTPIDDDGLRAALAAKTVTLSMLPQDPKMLMPERPATLTSLSKDLKDFCRRFAGDKTIFKPESAEVFRRI